MRTDQKNSRPSNGLKRRFKKKKAKLIWIWKVKWSPSKLYRPLNSKPSERIIKNLQGPDSSLIRKWASWMKWASTLAKKSRVQSRKYWTRKELLYLRLKFRTNCARSKREKRISNLQGSIPISFIKETPLKDHKIKYCAQLRKIAQMTTHFNRLIMKLRTSKENQQSSTKIK